MGLCVYIRVYGGGGIKRAYAKRRGYIERKIHRQSSDVFNERTGGKRNKGETKIERYREREVDREEAEEEEREVDDDYATRTREKDRQWRIT